MANKYNNQKILITGASGLIGRSLINYLSSENEVIGIDLVDKFNGKEKICFEQADISEKEIAESICKRHAPRIIIHCAGIAHQKTWSVDTTTYYKVNSASTENLAKAGVKYNPYVYFIFLSSVSIYGEKSGIKFVGENNECLPSSDYARSKLDAERRLIGLFNSGYLKNLIILRLAPVYDREWSFNLDKRIYAPKRISLLKFGSGMQKISALARQNLVEFIEFLIKDNSNKDIIKDKKEVSKKLKIYNVCDQLPYTFNEIIEVFKNNQAKNDRLVNVPLFPIWLATRFLGKSFPQRRDWIYSCYDKLAKDIVFDNSKMLSTGFTPRHDLKSVFWGDD